jgi:hypothetical protein
MLTAIFAMRFVPGDFEKPIMQALKNKDEEIQFEAVQAAGARELDDAWTHVKTLVTDPNTDKDLLLVAIEAIASIRPAEAWDVLHELADSDDQEIADAAREAIEMVRMGDDDEEDERP